MIEDERRSDPTREFIAHGRYVLLRKLRLQGDVEVYLGLRRTEEGFEQPVIIKRLRRTSGRDRRSAIALLEEARIAGQLAHPNIAAVLDVGNDEGGYYFVTEYVHGKSLRALLGVLADEQTVLPIEHAVHIGLAICSALSSAHAQRDSRAEQIGIVHGAISPDTVYVTFAGDVKIVDFGVVAGAQLIDAAPAAAPTSDAYAAPEQAKGEAADPSTDVYALGMILLELTTGRAPFRRPPSFAPDYPAKLAAILLQAAARRRAHRHDSAEELGAQLEKFARHERLHDSSALVGRFMRDLFRDDESPPPSERQETNSLPDTIRDEAETIPDPGPPALSLADLAADVRAQATTEIDGAWPELGLRPRTTAPPTARSWRPRVKRGRSPLVVTAFVAGVMAGLFAGSLRPQAVPSFTASHPADVQAADRGSIEIQSEPPGANVVLDRTNVRPSPSTFTLRVAIDPPDAALWVNGKFAAGHLVAGLAVDQDHRIAASAPGRIGKIVFVRSEQGGEKSLPLKLEPIRATR